MFDDTSFPCSKCELFKSLLLQYLKLAILIVRYAVRRPRWSWCPNLLNLALQIDKISLHLFHHSGHSRDVVVPYFLYSMIGACYLPSLVEVFEVRKLSIID